MILFSKHAKTCGSQQNIAWAHENPPHCWQCPGVLDQGASKLLALNTCINMLWGGARQAQGSKIRTCQNLVTPCWNSFSLLGASWALLGLSCAFLGCLLAFLVGFVAFGRAPGLILEGLGPFRECFWSLRPSFFQCFERTRACFSH